MSGTNWHDYYNKSLNGQGFDLALNKVVARKDVPPGMVFKYNEGGKNWYASLGHIRLNDNPDTPMRVSLQLMAPKFHHNQDSSDIKLPSNDARLTLSVNYNTNNSPCIIKGAFSFVAGPLTMENSGTVCQSVVPLDMAIASNIGTVIRRPTSDGGGTFILLGFAPELPEGRALAFMLPPYADNTTYTNIDGVHNPFITTLMYGQTIAVVGESKLHYWISEK